jgi:hypothetical protein
MCNGVKFCTFCTFYAGFYWWNFGGCTFYAARENEAMDVHGYTINIEWCEKCTFKILVFDGQNKLDKI